MFFLLTNFIYPLKKPIPLSKYFNFNFDNPRSRDEITAIRALIKKSWSLSNTLDGWGYKRLPLKKEAPHLVTFELLIEEFLTHHYGKQKAKKQVALIEGNKNAIIDFYTLNWVIVRYETNDMIEEYKKLKAAAQSMRKEGKKGFFLLDDEHIFEKKAKHLVDYSYLISLLAGDEEYFGWNFLVSSNPQEIIEYSPTIQIMRHIFDQAIGLNAPKSDKDSYRYNFEVFSQSIDEITKLIDERLNKKEIDEEVILYIGDILESAKPFKNQFSSLVRLTSIIEMLLTHQPDFSRFNVEESITKQFILKTSILVNNEKPSADLNETKKKLKRIYSQRSNIVHGNFSEVEKFVSELKKKEEYFEDLISDCYGYARIAIEGYLKYPKFVDFLKRN